MLAVFITDFKRGAFGEFFFSEKCVHLVIAPFSIVHSEVWRASILSHVGVLIGKT